MRIRAGFMPLLDAAVLVVAARRGFAQAEGIDLALQRESSWATIRDRLAVGQMEAAHMLGPMPIALNLGLAPLHARMAVPMALGLGGNAVTVSNALWAAMEGEGARPDLDPSAAGHALRRVVARGPARGLAGGAGGLRPRFAVVHPHSGHGYELRYWLAACGIDPGAVEVVVLPPQLMPDALLSGGLDGFCAGEPWNTAAVAQGSGRIAAVKARIWRQSPEKVLGVDEAWAEANPEALDALLRALYRAALWCGDAANRAELASLLAGQDVVGCPPEWLLPALSGDVGVGGGVFVPVPDFFVPHASAATFPWRSHALWFYSQMARWGQVGHSPEAARVAGGTYRPDLWRRALCPPHGPSGVALPGANSKVEGALDRATPVGSSGASLVLGPDGFFDGARFDPDALDAYVASQSR